ncbi:Pimeloyl-ACP methyl ester carboxylesterase [Actinacidiphila alni]|uniref:Pimeloyl-ACP methyl ester carboxylesterase n=1 Tax=Actinacidiphila alni TaxID=380248 RepID=A0A1I2GL52_9ACTN|nr:alpha/beta hydrolase [Actinacidiphila alni]SFF18202.1 Pimeloyl-ACP methyl ester carboxylesterase [Actinacidiphila alni]
MPIVTVDGARIPYRVEGSGPVLVLVHGTGAGSVTWESALGYFTDRYTVVLPDLSGSEAAEDDGGPLTAGLLAAQLAAVLADLGRGPVDVLGYSLGAPVAVLTAAEHPGLVRRLIALSGFCGQQDPYVHNGLSVWRTLADRPDAFARWAMVTAFSRPYLNSLTPQAVEALATAMRPTPNLLRQIDLDITLDIRAALPRVQAPALVIGCALDALVPVANARELAAGIAGSRYAELDSGHVARVERPAELAALVDGFLAETPVGDAA